LRFFNLRLEHFYGAGDDKTKFTTHVINSCLANLPELKLTQAKQRRDFVHIDDVVRAYSQLLARSTEFEPGFFEFGVGTGKAVRLREFVETVQLLANSRTQLLYGALPYREHEMMYSEADAAAIRALGWTCQYDLEAGLKQVIKAERSNLQHNLK
jgi:nucleoside-diphosphate-sugar epimerase